MVDALAIGLRALSFVAVLQAAGLPLFMWVFGDGLARSTRQLTALGRRTAGVALLLVIAHQVVEPARLTGSLRGLLDRGLQAALLASDAGTTAAIRVLGLALILLWLGKPSRLGAAATLSGGTLVVASFAFMGHTAADERRWLLSTLLIVHLLIVAFWFGALSPLHAISHHEEHATSGLLIERFSRLATPLVPVIFVAGLGLSIALLPSLDALGSPYGLLLLSKVGGFAALMALAGLNKWRLGPRIRGGDARALQLFRNSILAEWILVAGVLAVTATMTGLFSPPH